MKYFKLLSFLFVFSFLGFASQVFGTEHFSQINFTSDPDLEVGEVETITAQAQDEAGEPAKGGVGSLACIRVTSSSETGVFDSSESFENPEETLITNWNSNWVNNNFYYQDQSEGDYLLELEFAFRPDGAPTCPNWPYEEWEIDFVAEQEVSVSGDSSEEGFCPTETVGPDALELLLDLWGPVDDNNPQSMGADLNGDGVVDGFDLLSLLGMWGESCDW